MQEQRARARAAWAGSGDAATERVWFEIKEKAGASEFLGYATESAEGEILALVVDGARGDSAAGRSGCGGGAEPDAVLWRKRRSGRRYRRDLGAGRAGHHGDRHAEEAGRPVRPSRPGRGGGGEGLACRWWRRWIMARRGAIRAHHSATHLLHEALRRKLGTHVQQKGSLNAPDRLRFDVSQPRPITADELHWVEAEVNAQDPGELRGHDAADDAGGGGGTRARWRCSGRNTATRSGWSRWASRMATSRPGRSSCAAARMCGAPAISGISGLSGRPRWPPGVRRIEAVTGASAEALVAETQARLNDAAGALRAAPAEVPDRIAALLEDRRKLQSQVAELQKKLATGGGAAAAEDIGGIMLSARNLGEVPARDLKGLADAIGKQQGSGVVALVSTAEGKASIVVAVSADLTGRISAVDLVRAASAAVGGKGGGGRPDLAQAGGPDGPGRMRHWRRCGRRWRSSAGSPRGDHVLGLLARGFRSCGQLDRSGKYRVVLLARVAASIAGLLPA